MKGLRCANRSSSQPKSWTLRTGPSCQLCSCQGVCGQQQPGQRNPILTTSSPRHNFISRKHRKIASDPPLGKASPPLSLNQPSDPGSCYSIFLQFSLVFFHRFPSSEPSKVSFQLSNPLPVRFLTQEATSGYIRYSNPATLDTKIKCIFTQLSQARALALGEKESEDY